MFISLYWFENRLFYSLDRFPISGKYLGKRISTHRTNILIFQHRTIFG
jgi:hypothetical protein